MIRRASVEDLAAIAAVRTSVKENHLSVAEMVARGITSERIIGEMNSGKLGGWVAESEGEIVAFVMADRDDAQIFALFTLAGFERRGYGARLLDQALAWLKSHGHTEAWLSTGRDTRAQSFYQRRGWYLSSDDPNDASDILLTKPL
jgi:GNAT superfamily N-acetyltransferase